ncbi:MAG: DUF488 domain-containing protein [Candidatus Coatesbacteria bacterium]|nr:MAG: DUF488 domain-containing protein [Candidatus Coatesbacteria bacterium]
MPLHKIYTVGHSDHELVDFLAILNGHGIEAVADVRRAPYSRHVPQFNKRTLRTALTDAGIEYFYFGEALGGLPKSEIARADAMKRLEEIRLRPGFDEAIDGLLKLAEKRRTAVMCAEEDPTRCHRCIVLTPELQRRGARVLHIRADGRLDEAGNQEGLFA